MMMKFYYFTINKEALHMAVELENAEFVKLLISCKQTDPNILTIFIFKNLIELKINVFNDVSKIFIFK